MDRTLTPNKAQLIPMLFQPFGRVDIHGRGTGKSAGIGWSIMMNNKYMPRSVSSITCQTYGQALTRTLPSTLKWLETQFGILKDIHYVIGKRPPEHFKEPYEKIQRFEHVITFINGTSYLILSQDRPGSGRGPNLDYEILDEALTILKDRYDQEISPANRGNDEFFGRLSKKRIGWHHGFHYSSSMPYSSQQKWLLKFGEYYEKEAGLQIYEIWNRIVKMQMDLIEVTDPREFANQWNEILRLKKRITPFVSKSGILFTLNNVFDNERIDNLAYIRREYNKLTRLYFLIEIMNMIMDKVEDNYYGIDESRHVYYTGYNNDYLRGIAEDSNYDYKKLDTNDSRMDHDCDPDGILEISFDWGARISLMTVSQERNIDFVNGNMVDTDNFINEFYVKPDRNNTIMINELVDQFCNYYQWHNNKTLIYYRDRYGDQTMANSSKSYNEQAIDHLIRRGWDVEQKVHRGMEPPQHEKYLLWGNILKENNTDKFPRIRFNGNKCKFILISLNNTQVIEKEGKFKKNKKSEDISSGIPPEEATHYGDACDKKIWTKYGELLYLTNDFIPARLR